jgi:hypothetical protein
MEIKDPQTNTAGFSFDADKQSEAEQNRRMKIKKPDWKKEKKILFFPSACSHRRVGSRKLWKGQ